MARNTYTTFTVRISGTNIPIDSFNTRQFLTEEAALAKAKKCRDKYNASEFSADSGAKAIITRRLNKSDAKPL